MNNPYKSLDQRNFWKPSVADVHLLDISDLWQPKFKVDKKKKVATYGSCFAQHIGNAMKQRGFNWYITERGPSNIADHLVKRFNYNIFSSRTGNIYTTSLLNQWVKWSLKPEDQPSEYWEKDGRIIDPFRPNIEPEGFDSVEEMLQSRKEVLKRFKESFEKADFFVFTLGLTESWFNKLHGYEYPMCPGTYAGEYNEKEHEFINQDYNFIRKNLNEAINLMRSVNSNLKFILTVSPVPLVATFENKHVLVSTMHSKSILRAVAGSVAVDRAIVDYFPSYEIINSPAFQGFFFEKNKRAVSPHGVSFVMSEFFKCMEKYHKVNVGSLGASTHAKEDVVCEEEILGAFGGRK